MHANLRSFIEQLRRENELVEIQAEVDPYLEIAEIHRRVIDSQGKALLFKNVKNSKFPVITNLFGTNKRIDLAFTKKPQELVKTLVEMVEVLLPPKPKELWKFRGVAREIGQDGVRAGALERHQIFQDHAIALQPAALDCGVAPERRTPNRGLALVSGR